MGLMFSRIFDRFFDKKEVRILMVGFDAAGKTTILHKLKLGEVATTISTIGFNVKTVEYKNLKFNVWDIGKENLCRLLWRHYFKDAQGKRSRFYDVPGLVFVVDSNDRERIDEVREELHGMLNGDELRDAALLVFANKQDLPNAMQASEMAQRLGFSAHQGRQWHVQAACATSGAGLYEGLDWLSNTLSSAKR
ncbi:hypothetical protein SprV_0200719600 [Sparganum proliferum]